MLSQAWKQLKPKYFQRIQTNHDKGNLFSSNSIHGTQKSNTITQNMLNVGSMKLYYENMKRAKQVYDADHTLNWYSIKVPWSKLHFYIHVMRPSSWKKTSKYLQIFQNISMNLFKYLYNYIMNVQWMRGWHSWMISIHDDVGNNFGHDVSNVTYDTC